MFIIQYFNLFLFYILFTNELFLDIFDFNESDKLTLAVSPRFNWKDVEKFENRWR